LNEATNLLIKIDYDWTRSRLPSKTSSSKKILLEVYWCRMSHHASTRSNMLQSLVLRYKYYRMERLAASSSILKHFDANKSSIY